MRDKFLSILNSIEREKENILKSHMDDILNLIFVSVNKITGIAYVEHRKEILEELLNSCLNEIKESKTVKVYVSKEDLPMVEELIEPLKGKYVDIKKLASFNKRQYKGWRSCFRYRSCQSNRFF